MSGTKREGGACESGSGIRLITATFRTYVLHLPAITHFDQFVQNRNNSINYHPR